MTGVPGSDRERPPDYLSAWPDSDYSYYYLRTDSGLADDLGPVGEVDEFEPPTAVWLRPATAADGDDINDFADWAVPDGQVSWQGCWIECGETADGAVPYWGVRYA